MFRKSSLLAGLVALTFASWANAAPVATLTMVFDRAFAAATGSTLAPTENGFQATQAGYVTTTHTGTFRYRFNVFLALADPTGGGTSTTLAPGSDMQALGWSVNLLPGAGGATLVPNTSSAYGGLAGTYLTDVTDNTTGQSMFSTNSDAGTNTNDLQSILTIVASSAVALDRHPAEAVRPDPAWTTAGEGDDGLGYPTKIGTVSVLWNGIGTGSTLSLLSAAGTYLNLFTGNGNGSGASTPIDPANAQFLGQTVGIGPQGQVPEPATFGLIGLSMLGMLARRRVA